MLKSIASVGQNAAQAALEKARSSGATALIAATLLPLAAITPAYAGPSPYDGTISTVFNGDGTATFTISNITLTPNNRVIDLFIPEITLGDINFSLQTVANSAPISSYGLTFTEYANTGANFSLLQAANGNVTLPSSIAGYIDIGFSGSAFNSGSITLVATVSSQNTTLANGDFYFSVIGDRVSNNFSIPSGGSPSPTPVPEPGSLALLGSGLMGLLGLRRRKR